MPAQSVWMIRLSLVYLLLAVLIGGVLLFHKINPLHPAVWVLLPVHFELAIWGWLVQFVMGTAYWIFPRFMKGEARGSSTLAWSMVIAVNSGVWLIIAGSLSFSLNFGCLQFIGRGLLIAGMVLFAILLWFRVISYRYKHNH